MSKKTKTNARALTVHNAAPFMHYVLVPSAWRQVYTDVYNAKVSMSREDFKGYCKFLVGHGGMPAAMFAVYLVEGGELDLARLEIWLSALKNTYQKVNQNCSIHIEHSYIPYILKATEHKDGDTIWKNHTPLSDLAKSKKFRDSSLVAPVYRPELEFDFYYGLLPNYHGMAYWLDESIFAEQRNMQLAKLSARHADEIFPEMIEYGYYKFPMLVLTLQCVANRLSLNDLQRVLRIMRNLQMSVRA